MMDVLNFNQREEMKIYGEGYDSIIAYSHWQRFIEPFVIYKLDFPDFITYKNWQKEFPGWSHGEIDESHPLYERFEGMFFPMNEYYEKLKSIKK